MSTNLQSILTPISGDMQSLNEVIRTRLSSDVALINQISAYIIEAGGKRIRPALLLLTSQAIANGALSNIIWTWLPWWNLFIQPHFCMTMSWMNPICVVAERPPMQLLAMLPVYWSVIFYIPELFR